MAARPGARDACSCARSSAAATSAAASSSATRRSEAIERIVAQGQERGEFRTEVDPRLASLIVYGALKEILTGWVLGRLPDGDEEIARAERTFTEMFVSGLALRQSPVQT